MLSLQVGTSHVFVTCDDEGLRRFSEGFYNGDAVSERGRSSFSPSAQNMDEENVCILLAFRRYVSVLSLCSVLIRLSRHQPWFMVRSINGV